MSVSSSGASMFSAAVSSRETIDWALDLTGALEALDSGQYISDCLVAHDWVYLDE